jgi:hypothetical protein
MSRWPYMLLSLCLAACGGAAAAPTEFATGALGADGKADGVTTPCNSDDASGCDVTVTATAAKFPLGITFGSGIYGAADIVVENGDAISRVALSRALTAIAEQRQGAGAMCDYTPAGDDSPFAEYTIDSFLGFFAAGATPWVQQPSAIELAVLRTVLNQEGVGSLRFFAGQTSATFCYKQATIAYGLVYHTDSPTVYYVEFQTN